MCKPKNRVMCPDCARQKMLFETEQKAKNFIKWNGDKIDTKGGTLRPYYCPACCGWHISKQEHRDSYDNRTDRLIEAFERSVKYDKAKLSKVKHFGDVSVNRFSPKDIYNSMPQALKENGTKKDIKNFVSDFIIEHEVVEDDGGLVRRGVYELWRDRKAKKQS